MYFVCIFDMAFTGCCVLPESNAIMNNVGVGFVFLGCLS